MRCLRSFRRFCGEMNWLQKGPGVFRNGGGCAERDAAVAVDAAVDVDEKMKDVPLASVPTL